MCEVETEVQIKPQQWRWRSIALLRLVLKQCPVEGKHTCDVAWQWFSCCISSAELQLICYSHVKLQFLLQVPGGFRAPCHAQGGDLCLSARWWLLSLLAWQSLQGTRAADMEGAGQLWGFF